MTVNANKAGLVLGTLIGGWHFLWALVPTGWAQAILNLVFRIHFLAPPYTVQHFQPLLGSILIVTTSASGHGLYSRRPLELDSPIMAARLKVDIWLSRKRPSATHGKLKSAE